MTQTAGLFYKYKWHKMEYTKIRKISTKEKVRRKGERKFGEITFWRSRSFHSLWE